MPLRVALLDSARRNEINTVFYTPSLEKSPPGDVLFRILPIPAILVAFLPPPMLFLILKNVDANYLGRGSVFTLDLFPVIVVGVEESGAELVGPVDALPSAKPFRHLS